MFGIESKVLKLLKFRYRLLSADLHHLIRHSSSKLPPPRLRHRVHGSFCPKSYLEVGNSLANNIADLCKSENIPFHSLDNILDLGCGPARILSRLIEKGPNFYGADIDPDAIHWNMLHYPMATWNKNNWKPPLPYSKEKFDLVYTISLFTHLDEEMQMLWLREIKRVLKVNGTAIVSTHGKISIEKLSEEEIYQIQKFGHYYKVGETGLWKLDKLPNEYQTSYHSIDYVKRRWIEVFPEVKVREGAFNHHQDAVILTKRKT